MRLKYPTTEEWKIILEMEMENGKIILMENMENYIVSIKVVILSRNVVLKQQNIK